MKKKEQERQALSVKDGRQASVCVVVIIFALNKRVPVRSVHLRRARDIHSLYYKAVLSHMYKQPRLLQCILSLCIFLSVRIFHFVALKLIYQSVLFAKFFL